MFPVVCDANEVSGFDPDRPPLRHIRERDVDLMLLEEIRSTPEFRFELFLRLGAAELEHADFVGAYHSVRNSLGQSDLVVDFLVKDTKWRVYIENKIDADFQPEQAERYEQRAQLDLKKRLCDFYLIVLVAPAGYLKSVEALWHTISYEEILDWFEQTTILGERSKYKGELLRAAISKAARIVAINEAANKFHRKYWQYCQTSAKDLGMPKPRLKSGGFIQFYPSQLGNQFKFIHKLRHGVIDLQMRGMGKRLDEVRQVFGNSLGPGMSITRATQSAVIRMEVPQLIREEDFDSQKAKVIECLAVVTELADWLRCHASMTPKLWPAWAKGR